MEFGDGEFDARTGRARWISQSKSTPQIRGLLDRWRCTTTPPIERRLRLLHVLLESNGHKVKVAPTITLQSDAIG